MGRTRSRDVTVKYDEDLERHLKRRKIDAGDFVFNHDMIMQNQGNADGMIDKHYLTFLAHIRQTGIYESDDELDPQYVKFLKSLRKDGKSYTLFTNFEDGEPLCLKYEEDDELNDVHVPQMPRKNMSNVVIASSGLMKEGNGEMRKRGRKCRGQALEISTLGEYKDLKKEFRDSGEPYLDASHRKSARNDIIPAAGRRGMENCDPCYKIFLDNIKSEYPLIVKIGDSIIEYENVESPADSEILVTSNVLDFNVGNHNPFVASKEFITSSVEHMEQPSTRYHSSFKDRLMAVLKKPYNEMEYKRLMSEIKKRRPKNGRHRDLRGDASLRSYPTDEHNESYLEKHADLKVKMMEATMNRPKQLNLLRGFFFWLQNLAHDGAFPPWKDPMCLKVNLSGEDF